MLQNITIMFNGIISLKRSQPSSRQLSGETQRKGGGGDQPGQGMPYKKQRGGKGPYILSILFPGKKGKGQGNRARARNISRPRDSTASLKSKAGLCRGAACSPTPRKKNKLGRAWAKKEKSSVVMRGAGRGDSRSPAKATNAGSFNRGG